MTDWTRGDERTSGVRGVPGGRVRRRRARVPLILRISGRCGGCSVGSVMTTGPDEITGEEGAPSPHDRLFRAVFSRPREAEALVRSLMPRALAEALEPSSVRVLSSAFVDASLRASQGDLVLSARVGGRAVRVVVVLEHQSRVERRMALRVLRYGGEAWVEHAPSSGPLPMLLPIVVYAGPRPWTAPLDVGELIDGFDAGGADLFDGLRPRFRYLLDDLTTLTEAGLRARGLGELGALALWALSAVRRGGLRAAVPTLAGLLHDVRRTADGPEALSLLFRYLWSVLPVDERPLVDEVVRDIPDEERDAAMKTIADDMMERFRERLVAEAEARGRAEGEARGEGRGRTAVVEKQLRLRFGVLPAPAAARLRAMTSADLDMVAERLLFADTLEVALGG